MPAPRPERIESIVKAAKAAGAVRVRIGADGEIVVELQEPRFGADEADLVEWKR